MSKQSSADLAIYQNINLLAGEYRHYILKVAESFRLTAAQLHIIVSLEPGKSEPMKNLCNFLACDASYITTIIDRLHTEKLIERHESPDDRRIKMISLTEKGEHVRQLAISHLKDMNSVGVSQLTIDEKEQLADLLKKAVNSSK